MSKLVDIADAVVDVINGLSLPVATTAVRAFAPAFDKQDLADLKISVIPASERSERLDRTRWQFESTIGVVIQKAIASGADSENDAVSTMAEAILDGLRTNIPAFDTHISLLGLDRSPYADEQHLRSGVFTTQILARYRHWRA